MCYENKQILWKLPENPIGKPPEVVYLSIQRLREKAGYWKYSKVYSIKVLRSRTFLFQLRDVQMMRQNSKNASAAPTRITMRLPSPVSPQHWFLIRIRNDSAFDWPRDLDLQNTGVMIPYKLHC
jgi:hypothetical protein